MPATKRAGAQEITRLGPPIPTAWEPKEVAYDGEYRIIATCEDTLDTCRKCGERLALYGWVHQRIVDRPYLGDRVVIYLTRRRYICTACRCTSFHPTPDLIPGTKIMRRLAEYIIEAADTEAAEPLAKRVGLSGNTVRALLKRASPRAARKRGRPKRAEAK